MKMISSIFTFLSLYLVFTGHAHATECYQITDTSNMPSTDQYAPPYDVHSGNELVLKASCNETNVQLEVGNGRPNMLVNIEGHYAIAGDKEWTPFSYSGDAIYNKDDTWRIGKATANITLSEEDLSKGVSFLALTCTWVDGMWKCGCKDTACSKSFWQLQKFSSNPNTNSERKRLLTTLWNQYPVQSNLFYASDLDIVIPGCTAVAVGQLINYYFQHGYSDGWLDRLLDNTTAYPRVGKDLNGNGNYEADEYKTVVMKNLNYPTLNSYIDRFDYHDASDGGDFYTPDEEALADFLYHVGVALDADFNITDRSTGVDIYQGQEPYVWVTDTRTKIKSLLIDRFRFRSDISISGELTTLDQEKEYIKNSIDASLPVLISMYGNILYTNGVSRTAGHTAIIDNYKVDENGNFLVQINIGWGIDKDTGKAHAATEKWYSSNESVVINQTSRTVTFDKFYIYKNTIPINYRGTIN